MTIEQKEEVGAVAWFLLPTNAVADQTVARAVKSF
jgi:hypothetical protein